MIDPTTYELIVRTRFPTVVLRTDIGAPDDAGGAVLDAFLVPDELRGEFVAYLETEFDDLVDVAGLPPVLVLPHTVSATRRYYPEVAPPVIASSSAGA